VIPKVPTQSEALGGREKAYMTAMRLLSSIKRCRGFGRGDVFDSSKVVGLAFRLLKRDSTAPILRHPMYNSFQAISLFVWFYGKYLDYIEALLGLRSPGL